MDQDNEFLNEVFSRKKQNVRLNFKDEKSKAFKSRKATRKQERKNKKHLKHVNQLKRKGKFSTDKESQQVTSEDAEQSSVKKKPRKRKKKTEKQMEGDEDVEVEDEIQTMETYRQEALRAANEREDKHIAQLEKKLGLKKKGSKSAAFAGDGLDYLLEICEPSKKRRKELLSDEEDGRDETELDVYVREKRAKKQSALAANESHMVDQEHNTKEAIDEDDFYDEEDSDGEELSEDENEEDNTEEEDSLQSDSESKAIVVKKAADEAKQLPTSSSKYIPPTLRKKMENSAPITQIHLVKQIKGLLNRLSEANLIGISRELAEIYSKHSHTECNQVLTKVITDACVLPTIMPEKMMIDYIMLIVVLHAHIGTDVGAYFLESLVQSFVSFHSGILADTKQCDNIILLVALLYKFKIVQCLLIFDIFRVLTKSFTERDVEIILLILKTVGFDIRKDNPNSLQEIIKEVQSQAESHKELANQSRVKFMLEMINAIKNNNTKKVPQYDPSMHSHAQKLLKQILGTKEIVGEMELRVSLDDLCRANERGRWWIVGSAWSGNEKMDASSSVSDDPADGEGSARIIAMAKKYRMNTESRRRVFCAIMASEDYLDAFEKLLKLNLKDKLSRDVIYVVMECCLREKKYNPFYGHLAQKLCEFNRSNQVTLQYLTWDRFKQMSDLPPHSRCNLAHLTAHLFTSSAVSISILKV